MLWLGRKMERGAFSAQSEVRRSPGGAVNVTAAAAPFHLTLAHSQANPLAIDYHIQAPSSQSSKVTILPAQEKIASTSVSW